MGGVYNGNINVQVQNITPSYNCNVNSVNSSAVEILLIPSNPLRKGIIIYNQSAFKLNIKFGSGVTDQSFTIQLLPGSIYEMSQTILYAGDIFAVWDEADGHAHITELA